MTLKEWCIENKRSDILEQWDKERNVDMSPETIMPGSNKPVWWNCEKGHSWQTSVIKRTKRNNGCPYCSGHRVLKGFNDIETTHSNLLSEWDYSKNVIKPSEVSKGYETKVWWKCKYGHEWLASVNHRTSKKAGCPFCSGNYVIVGQTDLETTYPDISREWNHQKNNELTPRDVKAGSNKYVWWICDKGHEYKAQISARTLNKCGCPYCANRKLLKGFNDLKSLYPKVANEWDFDNNSCLPNEIVYSSSKKFWWVCDKGHKWQASAYSRTVKNTGCPVCAGRENQKHGIFAVEKPELAKEWHPNKNVNISPFDITVGSNIKVWWIGKCGHEWDAKVSERTKGNGCPYCAGKRVLKGFNDLQTLYPEIAKQWHPSKNGTLTPDTVTRNSNKKVWWICEKGHEWQRSLNSRTDNEGCPICSNRMVLTGYNDLKTRYPLFADEWDYEKNDILPDQIVFGSAKTVWWKCNKCGKEWKQSPHTRINMLTGCPRCKNDTQVSKPEKAIAYYLDKSGVIFEENYLIYKNFSLDIFIPSRNIGIEYDGQKWHKDVKRDIKKNQICKEQDITLYRIREPELPELDGYSKDIKIYNLTYDLTYMNDVILSLFDLLNISYNDVDIKRDGIDIVSYMKLSEKKNSLLETNKELAAEWDYSRNKDLSPAFFSRGADISVWWICPNGHNYKSMISTRSAGFGCPYCAGQKVLPGYNDLLSLYPNVAAEWNHEKNSMKPDEITSFSSRKVWWRCAKSHEWQDIVYNRTKKGSRCPYCSGRRAWPGFNDLATTDPGLAEYWNMEKNTLTPQQVSSGSNKTVWWKCPDCHYEWSRRIVDMSKKKRICPNCKKQRNPS